MNDEKFQTDRLVLRRWRDKDKPAFASMNADTRVMEYFPDLYTQERSDWMVDECNRRLDIDGFTFWAVDRKDRDEFIGFVGLNSFDAELPFCPCVEVGWRIAYEHWGNGFATEAAQKCLALGFNHFGLSRIVSFTSLANSRSRRVMEKIGMVNTDNNFMHPKVDAASGLQEHCLYQIKKE